MSKPASGAAGTPVASSPPASESLFSEFEGTAIGSVLDTTFGDAWEPPADASALNIVSWKLDVDARVEDGVDKRGFNGGLERYSATWPPKLTHSHLHGAQSPVKEGESIAREPETSASTRSTASTAAKGAPAIPL